MKETRISTIDDLKKAADHDWESFVLCLTSPLVSSKEIMWGGRKFHIIHGIDGTYETMTSAELETSNIGMSIKAGGFHIDRGE